MNKRDQSPAPLQSKDDGPIFDEAWQAQALAIADSLVKQGVIEAADWSQALGAEIRKRADSGEPDNAETYYCAVIAALEHLLDRSGTTSITEVEVRQRQWKEAYLKTPHGAPVELPKSKSNSI